MMDDNDYRHRRHCVFALHAHLVFVTKYRRKVFTANVRNDMRGLFAAVCADFAAALVEIDGEDDHVHLLVNYPPKVPLSRLVNSLKGYRAAAFARCIPLCVGVTASVFCGRPVTSPPRVSARRSASSANTSKED